MKNNVLKLIKYLYYFSLIALFILYLFPGSLIGYLLYEDLGKQPNLVDNPIGTSINHLFCVMYLTTLAVICNLTQNEIFTTFYFILFLSVFLEVLHYIIPHLSFDLYALFATVSVVSIILLLKRLIK